MPSPERWARIEAVFHSAADLPTEVRRAYLERECGDDASLRSEVESLLAQTTGHTDLADAAAIRVVAGALKARMHVGAHLGVYEVIEPIGAGGMGEVYKARDTRLGRDVAIKILRRFSALAPDARERFEREAQVLASLNHPNICTLYDIGIQGDLQYLVMEYVEGDSLAVKLKNGPLPLDAAVRLTTQIADGLAAAHARGIVHRDIKPANIVVNAHGDAKILDFGIAKLRRGDASGVAPSEPLLTTLTETGAVVGTIAYMSPEQLRGEASDQRSDLFSLGSVFYEMITGERAFNGANTTLTADAILHRSPGPLGSTTPSPVRSVIDRLLAKDPNERYSTAEEVSADLRRIERLLGSRAPSHARSLALIAIAAVLIASTVAAAWRLRRLSQERWAIETAPTEIEQLINAEQFEAAAAVCDRALRLAPNNPVLQRDLALATVEKSAVSNADPAEVFVKPYGASTSAWRHLGATPLAKARLPRGLYIWRFEKTGYATFVVLVKDVPRVEALLKPRDEVPPGMVLVSGGTATLQWPFESNARASKLAIDPFLIGRTEVTNAEFKQFVDAGGYERRELWQEPFVRDGLPIAWERAISAFRDKTGRPGPATWEAGSFPSGQEKRPVAGVSWYEAAAYARFVGRSLPTAYHWSKAATSGLASSLVQEGNFDSTETRDVGVGEIGGYGTADMAGNVKEWCSNQSGADTRFILGGGVGEPRYMFTMVDAASAWNRKANYGFRVASFPFGVPAESRKRLEFDRRDVWKDSIASDAEYKVLRGFYAYDPSDLHAVVRGQQEAEQWTHEVVQYDAAYGEERITAHLFTPKHATPPFQTVVYIKNGIAEPRFHPSDIDRYVDFLTKSGRAVLIPVLKGMWERGDDVRLGGPFGNPPGLWRDHVIMWTKDVSRSLDYLETRPDIDAQKFAYLGWSIGGGVGPIILAVDNRFHAAVLTSGGTWQQRAEPAADPLNFAPRVTVPVLMLNGRYDSLFPVEFGQLPIFRRLGTPAVDKRHVLYDAGHAALPPYEETRETLDWLDKYLGSIRRK